MKLVERWAGCHVDGLWIDMPTTGKPMVIRTFRRYNTPGDAHFVTFSCFQRRPFLQGDRARMWFCESLIRACILHDVALYGYVIMPNHVHLLVKPRDPEYLIGKFLFSVKKSTARRARSFRNESRKPADKWVKFYDDDDHDQKHFRFWQEGPGYDRNTWSPEEIREKLTYIHNNPVRSGLCSTPEEWYWSSAAFYAGGQPGPVPVEFPPL